MIDKIDMRGVKHDASKLESPEVEVFAEYTPKLNSTTFGSEEYYANLEGMKSALDHHYAFNRHHPEHFANGINDMTLVDILEMFCDWKASTLRHNDGNLLKSIETNAERFKMDGQLKQILINDRTLADELGVSANPDVVYVWCAELNRVDGELYYHPIIIPKGAEQGFTMPTLDCMLNVDYYSMMASENQFEAYRYENTAKMLELCHNNVHVKMISVPKTVYEKLRTALTTLVSAILDEAIQCFGHIDNIARMTHVDADMMKSQFIAGIFAKMTVVSSCFDQEMNVLDSTEHDYVLDIETDWDEEYLENCDEDCDEEDDDYDW
jgi:hypothetical protein